MKKILVFSHASVLEVNRDVFYHLSRLYEVDLRIACPTAWAGDLIRDLRCQASAKYPEIPVVSLPIALSGNGSLFFYKAKLREAFGDWDPDLVFVDEEPWSLACFQIYRAFPGAELAFYTKQNLKKKVPFPFSLLQKKVFARSAFCFSVSDEVSDVLKWKGFGGDIRYLPHSFDPERFREIAPPTKSEIRRGLGLREESCVVGYFGRLEPEKGMDDLFRAVEIVEERGHTEQIEFLIVGNGSMEPELKAFLAHRRKAKVVFRPAIPHDTVGNTLAAIDVLVLPSRTVKNWKEQFGRILIEAMACGIAVIGSDSGEIPHLIRRANAGLVFAERNADALALCIEQLAADFALRARMKANGKVFARENLAHESVARGLGRMLGLA